MKSAQEQYIWQSFKKGDKQAFADLFRSYYKPLFQFGLRIKPDAAESVEDCIQELFLELWQSRERIITPESVKGYLFKILKIKLLRAHTADQRFSTLLENTDQLHEFSYEAILVAEQANYETKAKIENALLGLSKRQREAIYLKFYSRMSYEEMEEVMGVSYQTVRNLVHQSIKILRDQIKLTAASVVWLGLGAIIGALLLFWLIQ